MATKPYLFEQKLRLGAVLELMNIKYTTAKYI